MRNVVFDPIIPPPFLAIAGLLLAAVTIYVYLNGGSRLRKSANFLLLSLRLFALALVLLLLLQPSRRQDVAERKIEKILLVGIDVSRSMKQEDAAKLSRLQSARNAIYDSKLLMTSDDATSSTRLFRFDDDAIPVALDALDGLKAEGATTHIHRSIETMLNSLSGNEAARGLVLFTDGHDFELANPMKTAAIARSRRVPLYAVPLGDQGLVRDVSVNITNYEPYSYVKQKAHIAGSIRLIGCEHEDLTVQLLRKDRVIKAIRANAGEQMELPVDFEVSEPEVGQYEYEIRVLPLQKEVDEKNNNAITFLNVIDQQIRVLLLEGAPDWDTTFLRRSLFQNDKIAVDAIVQYAPGKTRHISKTPRVNVEKNQRPAKEPWLPATQQEFNSYDIIILGKSLDPFFDGERLKLLVAFVKDHGGAVIFSRGEAFTAALPEKNELEPVSWSDKASNHVRFEVEREGRLLSPFRVLAEQPGGVDALPELLGARQATDRKALAAMLAQAHDTESDAALPAFVHRRYGRGQILTIAVDGLWRWSFNPKATVTNNVFDRFWDQLVLWLVASGDFTPSQQFSFRTSTANLLLGAKMHFRLSSRAPQSIPRELPVTIYEGEKEVGRTTLSPRDASDPTHLVADYLPEKVGRYHAVASLPDGQRQEVKWMVYDENLEEKEVAADVTYLKNLCEASGGKLLSPDELPKLMANFQKREGDLKPKVRLISMWDRAWVFYVICAAFGLDWHLRRKWGLS